LATKASVVLMQSDVKGPLALAKWVIYRFDSRQVKTKLNRFPSENYLFVFKGKVLLTSEAWV